MGAEAKREQRFELPGPLFAGLSFVHFFRGMFAALGRLESSALRGRLAAAPVDRPIYICGVPRCGTTVTLEMLSGHPRVATQRYSDMLMPYVPYAWTQLAKRLIRFIPDEPQQRIHQDGVVVTKVSPEGVEEVLWTQYFSALHSPEVSCVLKAEDARPDFDGFYVDTIKKLVLAREKSRFLSKANENVTRLLYLHRLFPDARFLLFIRHPAHHIASLMKTDRLFNSLAKSDPRVGKMTAYTGHFEFGPAKRWAKVGDNIGAIRQAYDAGEQAKAWALHWAEIYTLVKAQLAEHPSLAARTLIVRYEDLCRAPGETIDQLLAHCELEASEFAATRDGYLKKLAEPTYYRPEYAPQELADLDAITASTRLAYGYSESASDAVSQVRKAG